MSNQSTPRSHSPGAKSASNETISIPEPIRRSFADLIWYLTPVFTLVVILLCSLILYYEMKGVVQPLGGAGGDGDGPQPGANHQETSRVDGEVEKSEKTDVKSNDVGKLTVAEFVSVLEASDESLQKIAALLESSRESVEPSDRGDGDRQFRERLLSERLLSVTTRFREISEAKATLKQLEDQVKKRSDEKNDLEAKIREVKDAEKKLDDKIKVLHGDIVKISEGNGLSVKKSQLEQGRDTLQLLDDARLKMLENLDAIAKNQLVAAVSDTNTVWKSRTDWISRMPEVIPVHPQRLLIVIPLINRPAYDSVKTAVEPMEKEFETWETMFDRLEVWCYVVQGDREPELCRWPREYLQQNKDRNLWHISGNTGNLLPTQLKYPLTREPLKEGQVERYLFILPIDGTGDDITNFSFPEEVTVDVILVHNLTYAQVRAKDDEFRNQLYSIQKSAGMKMENLSVLPRKEGEFQARLRQLVRRSAVAVDEMKALKDDE